MAETGFFGKLALEEIFPQEVMRAALDLRRAEPLGGSSFRQILSRAVLRTLSDRGIEVEPYRGVVRQFLENGHFPDDSIAHLMELHQPLAPAEVDIRSRILSLQRSGAAQESIVVQRLTEEFQLKLLAVLLDARTETLCAEGARDTDPLTGLLNRRGVEGALRRLLQQNPGLAGAVLFLDVDHFKKVNDMQGHSKGDDALRYVAATLKRVVRGGPDVVGEKSEPDASASLLARQGGEEKLVVLPGVTNIVDAQAVAERIRGAIQAGASEALGFPLTVSVGVTVGALANFEELLKNSDKALYEAKHAGRNCVKVNLFSEPQEA